MKEENDSVLNGLLEELQISRADTTTQAKIPNYFIIESIKNLKVGETCEVDPKALLVDHENNCWLDPNVEIFRDIAFDIGNTLFDNLRLFRDEAGYHLSLLHTNQQKWRKQSETFLEDDREYRQMSNEFDLIPVVSFKVIVCEKIQ